MYQCSVSNSYVPFCFPRAPGSRDTSIECGVPFFVHAADKGQAKQAVAGVAALAGTCVSKSRKESHIHTKHTTPRSSELGLGPLRKKTCDVEEIIQLEGCKVDIRLWNNSVSKRVGSALSPNVAFAEELSKNLQTFVDVVDGAAKAGTDVFNAANDAAVAFAPYVDRAGKALTPVGETAVKLIEKNVAPVASDLIKYMSRPHIY
eukprot:505914-Prorocentrum_minimum.AAC.2